MLIRAINEFSRLEVLINKTHLTHTASEAQSGL